MVEYGAGYSSTPGSSTCDACEAHYFRSGDDCVACTEDAMGCKKQGVTLKGLPVAKFYYRFSEESNGVYSCADYKHAKNCLGSVANANTTAASRRLGSGAADDDADDVATSATKTWGDTTCVPDATGALCGVCRKGSYYSDDDEQCELGR